MRRIVQPISTGTLLVMLVFSLSLGLVFAYFVALIPLLGQPFDSLLPIAIGVVIALIGGAVTRR